MLKWVLGAVSFVVVLAVIFVGVVWFLFVREGPDQSHLTNLQQAKVLELLDTGSAYNVVYEYSYGGETYYGSTSIQSRSMHRGSTFGICVNPKQPAQHAVTYTDCSAGEPMSEVQGLKEKPEL